MDRGEISALDARQAVGDDVLNGGTQPSYVLGVVLNPCGVRRGATNVDEDRFLDRRAPDLQSPSKVGTRVLERSCLIIHLVRSLSK